MKFLITFLLILTLADDVAAKDCSWHERRADYYTDLRRSGGSASEMNHWLKKRNYHRQEFHNCRLDGGLTGQIDTVKGTGKVNNYADHRNHIHSNANDETLQKLIKTCNYWITTHNNTPSFDNKNFRDIACKAVSTREHEIRNPTTPEAPIVRSVKDCIKPDNVIDDEVKDCTQGKIAPYWIGEPNK